MLSLKRYKTGSAETINTSGRTSRTWGRHGYRAISNGRALRGSERRKHTETCEDPLTLLFHDVVPDDRWSESGFVSADADLYKLSCDSSFAAIWNAYDATCVGNSLPPPRCSQEKFPNPLLCSALMTAESVPQRISRTC